MLFETFGLFLAPFAAFALYLIVRARYPLAVEHWTRGRLSVLALTGLAAATAGLVLALAFAPRGHGLYVPAHMENGVLIPGKFE
jgi:hypothetical protein